ncbi:MAG: (E)-4-hydroxy-3-methylbut-2-enyl-diphosphate synthase [Verrucomicrobiae bacterium]|nr:(E)-4-hydroxy-3-methylbut-2-enyl-diphosphate synthase [Verrucomicrobiae bacterium]
MSLKYCPDPFGYQRRKTREVMVGAVGIGGDNPIRLQSMTTSDTQDTEATVRETLDLVEVGCEIVRITAPTVADAENLKNIRDELRRRGCRVPLVADIHFLPKAAMTAVEFVEKVRVNPGNYADKKKFAVREYTDDQYEDELCRIEEAFTPLVRRCKELERALRIGTNHGSLSDRILNRYGDTPLGMVESALEFVRICRANDFHAIVLSMKASNPKVMIQAYRLLAARLDEQGWDYPFHLGVTEAGDGEDGRIKSAVGIGALLEDGIGDTIRVSLTEDSVHEIPVCRDLAKPYQIPANLRCTLVQAPFPFLEKRDPYAYTRRKTTDASIGGLPVGGNAVLRVEIPLRLDSRVAETAKALAARPDAPAEVFRLLLGTEAEARQAVSLAAAAPDARFCWEISGDFGFLRVAEKGRVHKIAFDPRRAAPDALLDRATALDCALEIMVFPDRLDDARPFLDAAAKRGFRDLIISARPTDTILVISAYRRLAAWLDHHGFAVPLHLRESAPGAVGLGAMLDAAKEFGALLCDGLGDSIQIGDGADPAAALKLAYNILQAAGSRITKTEYVSCPSCGRTLFNLQTVTERIKVRTSHLKGVKLAVMGCIVNGPGEMADADFGYVGGAPGKINLYVGKECVQYHVPEAEAVDRLIDLMKSRGKWQEPASV